MNKNLIVILSCVLVGAYGLGGLFSTFSTPEAKYKTLKTFDGFDVRQYDTMVWASVQVHDNNRNKAFMSLANYIWGDNRLPEQPDHSTKIEMTVPVLDHKNADKVLFMSFVLPDRYKEVEKTPIPTNPEVKLSAHADKIFAVRRFKGRATEKRIAEHTKTLLDGIEGEEDVQRKEGSRIYLAQYNPPWEIPFFRRNEIWVEVDYEEKKLE
ncbi:hypothetical protein WA158_002916 [Blastocystis sp. Blastoise]